MWKNKQNFQLNPNEILFNGILRDIHLQHLCLVACRLEVNTVNHTFQIVPDPRFGLGKIVTDENIKTRVRKGILEWEKLVGS